MNRSLLLICFVFCLVAISCILFFSNSNDSQSIKQIAQRSGAWESMQFINTSRAFPERDIPNAAYTEAYNYYKKKFGEQEQNAGIASSTWYSLGPDNVGGRTLCMAFHPQDTATIWLGSASGGLWKSITGGIGFNAWTYIPTGYPVLGISSIAVDPINPGVMYIGTGETHSHGTSTNGLIERPTRGSVGMGILKSIDGGNSWFPSLDWQYQQARGIWDLQINPLNPNVVYAATTEGVYKTTDGGTNWNIVLNELMVMDILLDPIDTNYIYAGVGNAGSPNPGIYVSSDGGTNWNRASNGLPPPGNDGRITLTMNKNNHNSITALIANLYSTVGIYSSYDNGVTWNLKNGLTEIVSYQGWYAKGLCMNDLDSNQMLFGGVYLFSSDQNGAFPGLVPGAYDIHPDIHDIVSNPLDNQKIYILTDGGLFRSNNFGMSFYDCTQGYVTSQAYIGSVSHQDENIMLAGLQDNNTIRYYGTPFWDFVIGGDGSFNVIDYANDQIMYGSYQYLNVSRSTDQGFIFYDILNHSASAFGGNNVAFIAPFALSYSNTSILYAAGDSLKRSDDSGNSWTIPSNSQLNGGNVALCMAISWTEQDSIYVCTAPSDLRPMNVQLSGDGGITYTNVSAGLPNRFPRDIAVDPRDSKVVYVAFSGFGSGHLFKSVDAGANWTDISTNLPNIPFHCITHDFLHPDTLFAGSDLGVFVSVDAGLNWDALNTGLPTGVMIFDLAYSPADQSLIAFTHGNGIYKNTLSSIPVGFSNSHKKYSIKPEILGSIVNDELKFRINTNGELQIKIYDVQGKIISQSKLINQTGMANRINVRNLGSGIYFINLETENNSKSMKFIKH